MIFYNEIEQVHWHPIELTELNLSDDVMKLLSFVMVALVNGYLNKPVQAS